MGGMGLGGGGEQGYGIWYCMRGRGYGEVGKRLGWCGVWQDSHCGLIKQRIWGGAEQWLNW